MELKEYYVYQYLTEDGLPYYIGKGKGRRVHVDHKHIKLPPFDRRVIIANGLTNTEAAEKIRQANLGRPRDDRYEKVSLTKSKQRWYNNGTITKMFEPGKETEGFVPGRKGIDK